MPQHGTVLPSDLSVCKVRLRILALENSYKNKDLKKCQKQFLTAITTANCIYLFKPFIFYDFSRAKSNFRLTKMRRPYYTFFWSDWGERVLDFYLLQTRQDPTAVL
ncbi:hypothetical protein PYW08_004259 [Mythimna loreyi]|uniref:Uncharacterized protein n=3 Tax=Mythimna loreyi TaxID=667449 RepID=A0ACC2QNZ7_9NEOP|nr:hypothetical protein PYW08_004257 [Mythimna loreyi]KAJ8721856.1 hypothetical protein PYW08_004258 [Mythimna loreyi]KAJ8721857.1 hypothetical protein PYW08_004259 [Mythimna loreyi]